jgi:glyoxylase-like metal-dependent hydrolase (beta-lactamase superfamily II)
MPAWLEDLGGGVFAIDTGFGRERFDAAYLLVRGGRGAFIDTGTQFALPRLLGALDAAGLARDAVDFVIPTHVHLDHAGGVGALMRALPRASAIVHPRGLRHMVDPTALYDGARAVYGPEELARSYGDPVPVPAERARASADGMTLDLGGSTLRLADTPGHAKHHHCIWDEATRGWFTGDTFGLSYPEFDTERGAWILPTTTPVQFEPDALQASVQRLLAVQPACMYLTHFGRVTDVARLGADLLAMVQRIVVMAQAERDAPQRHPRLKDGLRRLFFEGVRAHGCTLADARVEELLAVDLELNAQGLASWLDRGARPRG